MDETGQEAEERHDKRAGKREVEGRSRRHTVGTFSPIPEVPDAGHPKLKGELAEVGFLFKALLLGLIVSKPYGDNSRYDFVVDNGRRFLGLQVKSTSARVTENLYVVNMERREMGRTLLYREGEVDFLAIYVVPEERWYIIPRAAIGKWTQVTLHKKVGGKLDRFGIYIDAWEQLRE